VTTTTTTNRKLRTFAQATFTAAALGLAALTGCGGGGGGGGGGGSAASSLAEAPPGTTTPSGTTTMPASGSPDNIQVPTSTTPTYFVATTGNDTTGDGSAGKPFATITKAVNTVPDGCLVLVKPGTYTGRVALDASFAAGITVRSEQPYQAKLRNDSRVVDVWTGQGIALEGFDIAHTGPNPRLDTVLFVTDRRGPAGGADRTRRIAFRNNVIHDSYYNDIVKINNGCTEISIVGNVFYNQGPMFMKDGNPYYHQHIDINSVTDILVEGNIFFNDFAGSGRPLNNDTSSYILVKDSDGAADGMLGCERINIRRNVFMNWEGTSGHNFLLMGEDGNSYYEARDVTIENNLLLGNSPTPMKAPFNAKGVSGIKFRYNTLVGSFPGRTWLRINRERNFAGTAYNMPSDIDFTGNVFSDPTGTMEWFSESADADVGTVNLADNVFWNGGKNLPVTATDVVQPTSDPTFVQPGVDPRLPSIPTAKIACPRWVPSTGRFAEGSRTIAEAFERLVDLYAVPGPDTPLIDRGNPAQAPTVDIKGRPRTGNPDVGCYER
jgi:hypothetical protein